MIRQTFALEDIYSSWQRTVINLSLVGERVLLWTVVRLALITSRIFVRCAMLALQGFLLCMR